MKGTLSATGMFGIVLVFLNRERTHIFSVDSTIVFKDNDIRRNQKLQKLCDAKYDWS